MNTDNLKRGIVQVLTANVLNMLFSLGTNFLLPKYLSVDSYAQIKTYQLYITYVAVLHFGYNDGMYLKYGGKSLSSIRDTDLNSNLSTLKIFQSFMMICAVIVSILLKDTALLFASIAILPQNLIAYYKNLYQATGEFKKYSKIMNLSTGLTFAINVCLIAVVGSDNYRLYLLLYVVLLVILWCFLERALHKTKNIDYFPHSFSMLEMKDNIKNGFLLLLGNFSSQILTSMDRWFVKILLGTTAFAQYAFAVSMENFLNVAVSPISVTLYNYFCNNREEKDVKRIRDIVVAFSAFIVSCAFPAKFILEVYLTQYLDSNNVIFLLFSAQIFYIIIKSVYVNLYKAEKRQRQYFTKLCFILVIGFVFNVVCYQVYHIKESFAVGTLLSAIIWFVISQMDFKSYRYTLSHYIFITITVSCFLLCGFYLEAIIGFLVYVIVEMVLVKVCLPDAFSFGLRYLQNYWKKIKTIRIKK